jgi:hypothetical protein
MRRSLLCGRWASSSTRATGKGAANERAVDCLRSRYRAHSAKHIGSICAAGSVGGWTKGGLAKSKRSSIGSAFASRAVRVGSSNASR